MLWWLLGIAQAATVTDVETQLAAIADLRTLRATKGAPTISADEVKRAAAGTIVTGLRDPPAGASFGKAYGAALIDVSIGLLWAALNDETARAGHPEWSPIAYSEVQSGSICKSGRKVLQVLDLGYLLSDRWWIGIITANATLMRESGGSVRELSWSSSVNPADVTTPGGQAVIPSAVAIGSTTGAWFLVAIDQNTTWLEYYSLSDPGGPVSAPSSTVKNGVKNNIEQLTQFAKDRKPSCPIE